MPGKDSLHTGVKAVTYRGKGSYILGYMEFPTEVNKLSCWSE